MVTITGKIAKEFGTLGRISVMRAGTTLGLALLLSSAVSATVLAQTTSPWPSSPAPAQPAQAAPAATPAKPATAAKPKPATAAKPAAKRTAAKPKPAAAVAATPAVALTPEQAGALKFTCSSQTASLCQGAAAGSPESYVCLQSKTEQLTGDCRTSVMAIEEANAVEVDPDAPAPAAAAPTARTRAQRPATPR
jgi:hypothetical protein